MMKGVKSLIVLVSFGALVMLYSCLDEDQFITLEEQLEQQNKLIDAYLEENNIDADITPEGLRYVIYEEGTGVNPTITSNIVVAYEGRYLANGKVFDSSTKAPFLLSNLITAWQISIPLLKEGGRMTIYAPAVYCYGGNDNMIFDITLKEVVQ